MNLIPHTPTGTVSASTRLLSFQVSELPIAASAGNDGSSTAPAVPSTAAAAATPFRTRLRPINNTAYPRSMETLDAQRPQPKST
jgi:hypothetical protein